MTRLPELTSGISCTMLCRTQHSNSSAASSSSAPAWNSRSMSRTSCLDANTTLPGYDPGSRRFSASFMLLSPGTQSSARCSPWVTCSVRPLVGFCTSVMFSYTSMYALCVWTAYSTCLGTVVAAARTRSACALILFSGCRSKNRRLASSRGGFKNATSTSCVCGRTSTFARTCAMGGGHSASARISYAKRPYVGSSNVRRAECAPIAKGKNATSNVAESPFQA